MLRCFALAAATVAIFVPAAPAAAATGFAPERIVVHYERGLSARAATLEAALGATLATEIEPLGVRVIEAPRDRVADVLAALRSDPAVRLAERDPLVDAEEVLPNDPLWRHQWSLVKTGAPRAWTLSQGSASIVVAVLDTGVDASHPDLHGKLVPGYDVVNGDADPADDHGHGTAVAGIVGAASNNAAGIAAMCWRCPVMPVKVLDGSGTGTDSQVAAGIVWAVDNGARVVNMSLGGNSPSTALAKAVDYAHERGVVLVAAAGNDGSSAPHYPAAYANVLGVAGTDENDGLYSWSNRGSWAELAAPGTNAATWPSSAYTSFAGTSSAAPIVAGIAGLALSAAPGTRVEELRQALTSTAVPVAGVAHGRVDAYAAVARLVRPQPSPAPSPPPPTPADSHVAPARPVPAPATPPASSPKNPVEPQPVPVPPAASPATTVRRIVDGKLGPRRNARSVRLAVTGGRVSAVVLAPKRLHITLTARDRHGRVVARARGFGRVELSRKLARGTYSYVVAAKSESPARFRLVLTQSRTAS